MRPLDFYDLGLRLAASADTDAEWRTVVGRLYYGLHHEACCRYFREYPGERPMPRRRRHAALIRRFDDSQMDAAKDIASTLRLIRHMREICDYELRGPIFFHQWPLSPEQLAQLALSVARDLLAALETFSPGEAPDGCDCPTSR